MGSSSRLTDYLSGALHKRPNAHKISPKKSEFEWKKHNAQEFKNMIYKTTLHLLSSISEK